MVVAFQGSELWMGFKVLGNWAVEESWRDRFTIMAVRTEFKLQDVGFEIVDSGLKAYNPGLKFQDV